MLQLTVLCSEPNSLRGVHVHLQKTDVVFVVEGGLDIWLRDLRPESPTSGTVTCVQLTRDPLRSLVIPPGVAHGFLSKGASTAVVATTAIYDPGDENACRWDDAELGFSWDCKSPILSERDREAPPLRSLLALMEGFSSA